MFNNAFHRQRETHPKREIERVAGERDRELKGEEEDQYLGGEGIIVLK